MNGLRGDCTLSKSRESTLRNRRKRPLSFSSNLRKRAVSAPLTASTPSLPFSTSSNSNVGGQSVVNAKDSTIKGEDSADATTSTDLLPTDILERIDLLTKQARARSLVSSVLNEAHHRQGIHASVGGKPTGIQQQGGEKGQPSRGTPSSILNRSMESGIPSNRQYSPPQQPQGRTQGLQSRHDPNLHQPNHHTNEVRISEQNSPMPLGMPPHHPSSQQASQYQKNHRYSMPQSQREQQGLVDQHLAFHQQQNQNPNNRQQVDLEIHRKHYQWQNEQKYRWKRVHFQQQAHRRETEHRERQRLGLRDENHNGGVHHGNVKHGSGGRWNTDVSSQHQMSRSGNNAYPQNQTQSRDRWRERLANINNSRGVGAAGRGPTGPATPKGEYGGGAYPPHEQPQQQPPHHRVSSSSPPPSHHMAAAQRYPEQYHTNVVQLDTPEHLIPGNQGQGVRPDTDQRVGQGVNLHQGVDRQGGGLLHDQSGKEQSSGMVAELKKVLLSGQKNVDNGHGPNTNSHDLSSSQHGNSRSNNSILPSDSSATSGAILTLSEQAKELERLELERTRLQKQRAVQQREIVESELAEERNQRKQIQALELLRDTQRAKREIRQQFPSSEIQFDENRKISKDGGGRSDDPQKSRGELLKEQDSQRTEMETFLKERRKQREQAPDLPPPPQELLQNDNAVWQKKTSVSTSNNQQSPPHHDYHDDQQQQNNGSQTMDIRQQRAQLTGRQRAARHRFDRLTRQVYSSTQDKKFTAALNLIRQYAQNHRADQTEILLDVPKLAGILARGIAKVKPRNLQQVLELNQKDELEPSSSTPRALEASLSELELADEESSSDEEESDTENNSARSSTNGLDTNLDSNLSWSSKVEELLEVCRDDLGASPEELENIYLQFVKTALRYRHWNYIAESTDYVRFEDHQFIPDEDVAGILASARLIWFAGGHSDGIGKFAASKVVEWLTRYHGLRVGTMTNNDDGGEESPSGTSSSTKEDHFSGQFYKNFVNSYWTKVERGRKPNGLRGLASLLTLLIDDNVLLDGPGAREAIGELSWRLLARLSTIGLEYNRQCMVLYNTLASHDLRPPASTSIVFLKSMMHPVLKHNLGLQQNVHGVYRHLCNTPDAGAHAKLLALKMMLCVDFLPGYGLLTKAGSNHHQAGGRMAQSGIRSHLSMSDNVTTVLSELRKEPGSADVIKEATELAIALYTKDDDVSGALC
eukprot:g172.t1